MENYTRVVEINQGTGEITDEYYSKNKGSFYLGPKKYERIMEMFNEMLIKNSGKAGVKVVLYIKDKTTVEYKLEINNISKLARDLDVDRSGLIKIINGMVKDGYLKKINKYEYAVNPELFWISNVDHKEWQELKKEYNKWTPTSGSITKNVSR